MMELEAGRLNKTERGGSVITSEVQNNHRSHGHGAVSFITLLLLEFFMIFCFPFSKSLYTVTVIF